METFGLIVLCIVIFLAFLFMIGFCLFLGFMWGLSTVIDSLIGGFIKGKTGAR